MKLFNINIDPFISAWELLLDISLPKHFEIENENSLNNDTVLLNFTTVAIIIGIALYAACSFLKIVPGGTAGIVFSSLAATLFLEYTTGGRGLASITSFLYNISNKHKLTLNLANLNTDINAIKDSKQQLLLMSAFIIRLTAIGIMVYHGALSMIIVALILGNTIQSVLASGIKLGSEEPFFETSEKFETHLWLLSGILCIITGICYFALAIISLASTILIAVLLKKYYRENLGGHTAAMISFSGYITELAILILAATFIN